MKFAIPIGQFTRRCLVPVRRADIGRGGKLNDKAGNDLRRRTYLQNVVCSLQTGSPCPLNPPPNSKIRSSDERALQKIKNFEERQRLRNELRSQRKKGGHYTSIPLAEILTYAKPPCPEQLTAENIDAVICALSPTDCNLLFDSLVQEEQSALISGVQTTTLLYFLRIISENNLCRWFENLSPAEKRKIAQQLPFEAQRLLFQRVTPQPRHQFYTAHQHQTNDTRPAFFAALHPEDQAFLFQILNNHERRELFRLLPRDQRLALFAALDGPGQRTLFVVLAIGPRQHLIQILPDPLLCNLFDHLLTDDYESFYSAFGEEVAEEGENDVLWPRLGEERTVRLLESLGYNTSKPAPPPPATTDIHAALGEIRRMLAEADHLSPKPENKIREVRKEIRDVFECLTNLGLPQGLDPILQQLSPCAIRIFFMTLHVFKQMRFCDLIKTRGGLTLLAHALLFKGEQVCPQILMWKNVEALFTALRDDRWRDLPPEARELYFRLHPEEAVRYFVRYPSN